MGLTKRLEAGESSFAATVIHGPVGTAGWRAPEVLSGDVRLDDTLPNEGQRRLTRLVDIFALGLVFVCHSSKLKSATEKFLQYYVMSEGTHIMNINFRR